MMLITGGARSGKSGLAERFAARHGERVLYIATSVITDAEMAERIAHHRDSRPASWLTHEGYADLDQVIREADGRCDAVMLECITTLITNLLFAEAGDTDPEQMDFVAIEAAISRQIDALIRAENANNPFSDEELKHELVSSGFVVSRRTIAKYRTSMGIPTSQMRMRA